LKSSLKKIEKLVVVGNNNKNNMVKNIMAGFICLFCVNMLLNKAKVTELENRIEQEEIKLWHLEEQLLVEEYYADSLERLVIDILLEYEQNTN